MLPLKPSESVTVTVKLKVAATVGVPENDPLELIVVLVGRAPDVTREGVRLNAGDEARSPERN